MNNKLSKILGIVTLVFGVLFIATGATAWFLVSDQLKDEQITVSGDAPFAAGKTVGGPITAFAQAEVIKMHALESSNGETYATLGSLSREAEAAGDTAAAEEYKAQRTNMMNASFLRSSLFTSVLAYGVSLFAIGVGAWMLLAGATFVSGNKRDVREADYARRDVRNDEIARDEVRRDDRI